MQTRPEKLWRCPSCGRQFRQKNNYHSCDLYPLEAHFMGKSPLVRELYDHLLSELEQFGPIAVYPIKTRIVFQAEVQFAMAIPHKRWLEVQFWLLRSAAHPKIKKIEMGVFRDYGHIFRMSRQEDLDQALINLLHEAFVLGLATG